MNFMNGLRNYLTSFWGEGGDPKHQCLYSEFGYPELVTYELCRRAYDRVGVAKGSIHCLRDKAFQTMPNVFEGEEDRDESKEDTAIDKQFKLFAKRTQLWRIYSDVTIRRSVGVYAAMLIQIADGKDWQEKAENVTPDKIVKFISCWQDQIYVSKWEDDPNSENWGEPLQYTYLAFDPQAAKTAQAVPTRALTVHHSRVVYFGDIRGDGSSPTTETMVLRNGYNSLKTIEKVIGAGGEGAYKNAARHLGINFDGQVQPAQLAQMLGVKVDELGDAFNKIGKDLNQNFDAVLALMGAQTQVLSTQLPDLEEPFNNAMQDFAASRQIPSKIIIGNQQGERASSEDNISFALRAQAYRENVLDYEIEKILKAFAKIGLWQNVQWAIKWDELINASDAEKIDMAKVMSEVLVNLEAAGYNGGITLGEIRTKMDLTPEPELSAEEKELKKRADDFDRVDIVE